MLPRPTAAPTALRENARSDDQRWPLTSSARRSPSAASRARQSWSDCNHARREPGASLLLRPGDNNDRTGFGHLVQVRQHFNLIVIEPEDVALERVIILGGGEAGIRIRRFMPGGGNAALL